MRHLIRVVVGGRDEDEGAALPFVAVILVLLLGMAAFSIDLGWIYLNGARVQRAADAAALAGVVYLPGDYGGVDAYTTHGANANGYAVGTVNIGPAPVGPGGSDTLSWRQLADNELEVTLTSTIETFFLKVLGFDTMTISRKATAVYVKPVPIGNPDNDFGDGSDNFWAAINGRYTAHMHGDPYQAYCDWADGLSDSDCIDSHDPPTGAFAEATVRDGDLDDDGLATNPLFRGDGYYYGIEAQNDAGPFEVRLFDPEFRTSDTSDAGDTVTLSFSPNEAEDNIGPSTSFRLYEPDDTPLDPTDNDVIPHPGCDQTFGPVTGGFAQWAHLCTVGSPKSGIYVLQVSTIGGSGSNNYGIEVNTLGPGDDPDVYGINEISIHTNQDDTNATLYLAKIDPIHAGKILELKFYDAGEDDGPASYTVKRSDGSNAQCYWEAEAGETGAGDPDDRTTWPDCVIATTYDSGGWLPRFNAQWLTAEVDLPSTYACDPDEDDPTDPDTCWWTMEIANSQPHDRTTWTARVTGNPVHLVPNP